MAVYQEQITALTKASYSFAPACCNRQRASCVAALGAELYKKGSFETAAEHAPEYLRLSQAERERAAQTADKYHIREMQQSDLEEVTALEASCFSMPWKYRDFEETLTNPNRVYLVAETDAADIKEHILGGCMLTNIAGEGDITNVAVREAYRGKKIAAALMEALLKFGRERYGITAFTLEVRSQNTAARNLYEKLGFVSKGVRPGFYEKPKDDAVILWKE